MPGVQNPHCRPCLFQNASCIGCSLPSVASPSMVVIVDAVGLHREPRARFDRDAVDEHRAGAALAGVAADLGAGEAERLAQEVHEQQPRLDVALIGAAVDGDPDGECHELSLL